ncbi:MAG: metal-dependent transcriptional regulator [Oscillospiraceae bacterium]|nr:metal-dependent transcriptional regulator [Oscillospiraceae bacterium]
MTPSMEDYIEAIYALGDARDPVRLTDIAQRLGLTKASVSRAVHSLSEEGLITHQRYGTLSLTEAGIRLAREVYHRHTLFKRFLTERLYLPEDVAEHDACRMEHAAGPQTIEALERFLNE